MCYARIYIHIYIYVPLFHRACQFRDCISARITASTSTSSSSSLDCIPNLRFILYARTVSGMGLKRSPLDVQPVWSGYNCTRVFHRFRSGIEPKIVLNRKVFCTRNTFARIIYFTRIFFHSFFLSFFFHSNNFKSIIRIVISSRKNPFPSPLSLSLDRTCNPPSWISTGFQCRFGYYTLSITFSIGSSR